MSLYQHRFHGHTAMGDSFVFSWWAESTRTTDAANDAAGAWAATVWDGSPSGTGYEAMTTAAVGIDRITTGLIDPLTGTQLELAEDGVDIDGTDAGNAMPGDVAIVVSLRTSLANRRGRGRFYLPQPAASTLTATGKLAAASITALINALGAAWSVYNAGGHTPVVYSRASRSTQEVTTFNVGDLYDTQRRRENDITETRTTGLMP